MNYKNVDLNDIVISTICALLLALPMIVVPFEYKGILFVGILLGVFVSGILNTIIVKNKNN